MDCPHCSTPHAPAAQFCARCGTALHSHTDRDDHFAAHPDEPVRSLAVLSTLLPHVSGHRHHLYRNAILVGFLASVVAAGFGVLSVALICASVALPAVVLVYLHDHDIWRAEPMTVLGGGFVLALAFGIAIGLLQKHWATMSVLSSTGHQLPSGTHIVELGIVVPVTAILALVAIPVLVTSRPAFGHPLDAVNMATLAGAALSLGLSLTVQQGAFTHAVSSHTDPARTFFIAITLGLIQPVLFATAAALVAMRVRRSGSNPALGVIEGVLLVVVYDLAAVLLGPYGSRGVVFTALIAAALAATGVLLVRIELHDGLLAEARAALADGASTERAAIAGQTCAHCGVDVGAGAAFCQVCGAAIAAQAVPHPTARAASALAPSAA